MQSKQLTRNLEKTSSAFIFYLFCIKTEEEVFEKFYYRVVEIKNKSLFILASCLYNQNPELLELDNMRCQIIRIF